MDISKRIVVEKNDDEFKLPKLTWGIRRNRSKDSTEAEEPVFKEASLYRSDRLDVGIDRGLDHGAIYICDKEDGHWLMLTAKEAAGLAEVLEKLASELTD